MMNVVLWQDAVACRQHHRYFNTVVAHLDNSSHLAPLSVCPRKCTDLGSFTQYTHAVPRFNALYLYLWLYDRLKHGSNASSERDASSKAAAPMKQNR